MCSDLCSDYLIEHDALGRRDEPPGLHIVSSESPSKGDDETVCHLGNYVDDGAEVSRE